MNVVDGHEEAKWVANIDVVDNDKIDEVNQNVDEVNLVYNVGRLTRLTNTVDEVNVV